MTRSHITFLFCCLSVVGSSVFAGPWPRAKGTGIIQLGFSTIGYNKVYDDKGTKQTIGSDVRDNVISLFGEYGVVENVTASIVVPFKLITVSNQLFLNDSKAGNIGDIDLGVKYTWHNSNGLVLSSEVLLGLPTGKTASTGGLYLGDGEFNVLARVLAGKSFYPIPLYLSGDAGFNFRSNNFSNDVQFGLEAGYGIVEGRLFLILQMAAAISTNNRPTFVPGAGTSDLSAAYFGLYSNNREFTAFVPKLYYKATKELGISVSYATATHGRNVAGGAVLAGGVLYEF